MGTIRQLAIPFLTLNLGLLIFNLLSFYFLESGSATFTVAILGSVILGINSLIALAVIYSDWDI